MLWATIIQIRYFNIVMKTESKWYKCYIKLEFRLNLESFARKHIETTIRIYGLNCNSLQNDYENLFQLWKTFKLYKRRRDILTCCISSASSLLTPCLVVILILVSRRTIVALRVVLAKTIFLPLKPNGKSDISYS